MRFDRPAASNPFRQQRSVFSMRREQTPEGAAVEQRFREKQRAQAQIEHMASVVDLHDYLERTGHADACEHAYSCDPWKYEPLLLDDLIRERLAANDAQKMNQLRALVRAGSWMSYPRMTRPEIMERLTAVRAQETSAWNWRIRQADPDTSKELTEDLSEVESDLRKIERAIEENVVGDALEDATKVIEDLSARLWLELKQLIAIHGLQPDEIRRNPLTKPLVQEIDRVRPIRDLLYYRRLYPVQATRSFQTQRPAERKRPGT